MKKTAALTLLLFTLFTANAQKKRIDTLRLALSQAKTDTMRFEALRNLDNAYYNSNPDSAILFGQQSFLLAKKNNWTISQARARNNIASDYLSMGDYVKCTQNFLQALKMYEALHDLAGMSSVNANIGFSCYEQHDFKGSLAYTMTAKKQLETYALTHILTNRQEHLYANIFDNLGGSYFILHNIDSAENNLKISYELAKKYKFDGMMGDIQDYLGKVAEARGKNAVAVQLFRQALATDRLVGDAEHMCEGYRDMADLYHRGKQQDSAEYYAKKALETAQSGHFEQDALDAGKALYTYYDEDHNLPEAYKYLKLATAAKDSLYNQDKVKQLLSIDFDEKERQQELQVAQKEARAEAENRLRTYILSGGLGVLLLLALIFWRNSRQRQKANKLLHRQKEDIENAMAQLKLTQNQLIQSEKMASLGELTAGIAHEIQNPLNFVNNFSEVNRELIDEMQQEIEKGHYKDAKAISDDIKENEEKINHHGKRADFIVKGMLQHSRASTGERQLTNINILAEEFFKLSYQGLRAKDKAFNCEMVTHLDPNLPKPNVVQQDIGRVLLNLFNNAFYAVNQKAKTEGPDYKPTVELTTFTPPSGGLGVKVKDNGVGIPDAIKEKILQPFFTTKPTGEGTGLGLSLSYDILVKGHNGTLDIESTEGEGSEFIVKLPFN